MSQSILARTETGEVQLTITIPKEEVKKTYEEVFDKLAEETEIPGFRKGKAPRKLVEEKIDKTKVYEKVLQQLVPHAYIEAIKEHNLKPILSPKVELLKAKQDENWEVRATTCERPAVSLVDYKETLKKELAPSKIWTPNGKTATTEAQKSTESTEEEKTQKVIQALLENIKVTLPEILVEDELNRTLSNLINQTEKLGLTIDQYLSSIGKSAEQLRSEYQKRSEDDLKLQFILDEIAKDEKIEVKDEEIDNLIATAGDEKIKQDLNLPLNRTYLRGILTRRKVLDFLTKL